MAGLVAPRRRNHLNSPPLDTRGQGAAVAGSGQWLAVGADRPALALGAWLKNTVCALADGTAMVSACVGDLDTVEACLAHEAAATALIDWLEARGRRPHLIAHDLHPDFHSSRHAAVLSRWLGVPCLAVQHHHAHIAAICAEHALRGPVLGLALDGTGLGADNTAWGGELLHVEGPHYRRLTHLLHLPLPGGDAAAREPWRMAAAVLHRLGRGDEIARRFAAQAAAAQLPLLLARQINCPPTSSMGRVFDAAAGLLGLCPVMRFEAEAAIALEQAAARHGPCAPLAGGWEIHADGRLDLLPLLAHLADLNDIGHGAALFHATLIAALGDWLSALAHQTGLRVVVAGGGCLCNRLLSEGLREHCRASGLHWIEARALPPGDAAIALGQAWVASMTEH